MPDQDQRVQSVMREWSNQVPQVINWMSIDQLVALAGAAVRGLSGEPDSWTEGEVIPDHVAAVYLPHDTEGLAPWRRERDDKGELTGMWEQPTRMGEAALLDMAGRVYRNPPTQPADESSAVLQAEAEHPAYQQVLGALDSARWVLQHMLDREGRVVSKLDAAKLRLAMRQCAESIDALQELAGEIDE